MKKLILTLVILLLFTSLNSSLFAQRFAPTVDTYIDQSAANVDKPYGTLQTFTVKTQASFTRITFFEFNLSDFSEQVSKAELCIYFSSVTNAGTEIVDVYEVTSGTISNTITWTNFNAAYTLAATPITSLSIVNTALGWYKFDIKDLVNTVAATSGTNKKIKLALKARNSVLLLNFYSSEQSTYPQYTPFLVMTPAMPSGLIEKSRTAVIEDGYIQDYYPTSSYNDEKLIVNYYYPAAGKQLINANLRFNVPSATLGDNTKVTIKTKVKSADTGTNTFVVDLKGIDNLDDATNVNTLTWNTMPAAGNYTSLRSRFFSAADKTNETDVEWDVTSYVKAQKTAGKTYANFTLQVPELGYAGGGYLSFYSLNYLNTHAGSTFIPELIVYDLPLSLTTQAVSGIAATTAVGNGNITNLGATNPTQHGFCWNTSTNPTIANSKSENGVASATGAFTSSLPTLTPNTTYYVKSYATAGGVTTYGNEVSFTTLPAAPTSIAATNVGSAAFYAAWIAPTQGAVSFTYTVEYGTVSDLSSGTTLIQSLVSSALSKSISGLNANTTYYYRVKAVNATGSGAWSAIQTVITKTNIPTSSAASAIIASGFTANWTVLTDGPASFTYTVQYSTSTSGGTIYYIQNIPSANSSVAITGINANTTYYYWVKGANAAAAVSGLSAMQTVTTLPAAPTSTAGGTITTSGFTANWTAPTHGSATFTYTVEYGTVANLSSGTTEVASIASSNLSSAIGSLVPNTNYYYRIKAVNASGSGSWSEIQTVKTLTVTWTGTGSWSSSGNWSSGSVPATDLDVIVQNGELTIDQSTTVKSLTINPGAKLTISSGQTFSATNGITLQSTSDGTATLVDETAGSGQTLTGSVQQYLATTRNWYVSSPVSNANAPSGYTYYRRNEPAVGWTSVSSGIGLVAGVGYIALPNSSGPITFTTESGGKINTGNIDISLSWQGSSAKGYNLIGNPYPSHLIWNKAFTDANASKIEPTIWYRTNSGGSNASGWSFKTYNAFTGVGVPAETTGIIPPMQAFWVLAKADGQSIQFTNTMRSHQSSNPLKAPATQLSENKLIRLQVSNGTATDETVLLFNANALDSYDNFDSQKMLNNDTNVPDLYSVMDNKKLVINGMSDAKYDTEITLGFNTLQTSDFSISANEISNFEAGTKIILRDKLRTKEIELKNAVQYTFTSDATSTENRFSILLKAPSAITKEISKYDTGISVYNINNEIVVSCSDALLGEGVVTIYSIVGNQLLSTKLNSAITKIKTSLTSGIYLVTVTNAEKSTTKRIIIHN